MSKLTEEIWEVVEIDDLSYDDVVIVSREPVKGVVRYLDHLEDNVEVKIDNVEANLDIFGDQGYVIKRLRKRDVRSIKDIVGDPTSVSNRKLLVEDPYGKIHEVNYSGSLGIRIYPGGTVTFSSPEDPGGVYVADGIKGFVEVV